MWGHKSTMVVTTVSKTVNCVPKPSVSSIMKNRMDHSGAIGNWETASGYTMNANPAPN